jgi:hypothetical protein
VPRRSGPLELHELGHAREITPDWLQREQAVGYVTYVDRFARRWPACASGFLAFT